MTKKNCLQCKKEFYQVLTGTEVDFCSYVCTVQYYEQFTKNRESDAIGVAYESKEKE